MGIQDRDYNQEHYRNVTRLNRRRDAWSTGRVALFWIAVLAVAFLIVRVLPNFRSESPRPAPAPSPAKLAANEPMPTIPKAAPARPVVAHPALPESRSAPAPDAAPIYRCGNAYGLAPCTQGRAVEAPAASGFDSRPNERLARLVAEGRTNAVDTVTTETRIVNHSNATLCASLSAEIATIDREARRPLSSQEQDLLRDNRRLARNRQIALHC